MRRGASAEDFVAAELHRLGWQILARRWQAAGGELDLVVCRSDAVRFVEVKARSDDALDPLESISVSKRTKLARAAQAWIDREAPAEEYAFLVAVVDTSAEPWHVQLLDDAFDV